MIHVIFITGLEPGTFVVTENVYDTQLNNYHEMVILFMYIVVIFNFSLLILSNYYYCEVFLKQRYPDLKIIILKFKSAFVLFECICIDFKIFKLIND